MTKNLYLELSDRSKQILKGVIESYLQTGEPVGSETILKRININISSSSIRSILANLQKNGFRIRVLQTNLRVHIIKYNIHYIKFHSLES